MIRNSNSLHVSLDSIYNEIINLSNSIGVVQTSIEHLNAQVQGLSTKIEILSEDKIRREQNYKILWGLFQFSPGIFVKILCFIVIGMLLCCLPFSDDFKVIMANFIK